MIQIPMNLGQRILEAARIAAAIHREESMGGLTADVTAGGAGLGAGNRDLFSKDGTAVTPDSGRPRIR